MSFIKILKQGEKDIWTFNILKANLKEASDEVNIIEYRGQKLRKKT